MKKFFEQIRVKAYSMLTYSYEYPKLGRWKIEYNTTVIHCKIDQANDHSCWSAELKENDRQEEEYMLPYCM